MRRNRPRTTRSAPKPVTVALVSENGKTGPCAVTYAPQTTCPESCPLYANGCYAEYGPTSLIERRVAAAAAGMTVLELAAFEAAEIDRLPAYNDMRLHAVGDCRTAAAAQVVSAAAERYAERANGPGQRPVAVWTYTHAWREVPRAAWGSVSVLASVETPADIERAWADGYAVALTVADWYNGDPRPWTVPSESGDWTVVPCPYQTKGTQCVRCRLCLDAADLWDNRWVIAFKAHGSGRSSVVRQLDVLNAAGA